MENLSQIEVDNMDTSDIFVIVYHCDKHNIPPFTPFTFQVQAMVHAKRGEGFF